MYVEPWIFWLILAPIAAVSAIYLGYLLFALAILGGAYALLGVCKCGEALSAGLGVGLFPFRHLGPWFDYVACTAVLAALVGVAALLS